MTDEINNLFKDVRQTRLSEQEKMLMRNELEFFIAENPPKAPLHIRAADYVASYFESGAGSGLRMHPIATACAFVLVLGVGTSYAAGGALPGDALYAIKTRVNEPVQGIFAVTESAQAEWKTEIMTRRLIEAETLAAEGRLTPVVRAEIEAHINKTADEFDATVASLAKQENGVAKVAEAQSDLEASLIGHADVIATLSTELPESRPTLSKILTVVKARATLTQNARANAEVALAKSKNDKVRTLALEKRTAANGALSTVQARNNSRAANMAADQNRSMTMMAMADAPAEPPTLSAEQALSVGEQKLEAGEYGEAFSTFQAVLRAAKTASVHIEAEKRLNTSIEAIVAADATSTATSTATTTDD